MSLSLVFIVINHTSRLMTLKQNWPPKSTLLVKQLKVYHRWATDKNK